MDCTDCEWPYRVVQRCLTGNVPQVLLRARRHGQNLTTIRNAGHRIDATKSHFQYFYSLYPRTPLPDYIALCRVIDQVPMTSLDELARAGRWLVELARYPGRRSAKAYGYTLAINLQTIKWINGRRSRDLSPFPNTTGKYGSEIQIIQGLHYLNRI